MPHPSRVDDLQKSIARFAIIMTVGGLGFLATYFLTGGLASDDAKLGSVDGFDQDECGGDGNDGSEISLRLLAA